MEMCQLLAQCNTDIDLPDNAGETPLYYAIRYNQAAVVRFLIERGANIDHENAKHSTPYTIAKKHANKEIVQLLYNSGAKSNESYR